MIDNGIRQIHDKTYLYCSSGGLFTTKLMQTTKTGAFEMSLAKQGLGFFGVPSLRSSIPTTPNLFLLSTMKSFDQVEFRPDILRQDLY
jgi:hypothetical protein